MLSPTRFALISLLPAAIVFVGVRLALAPTSSPIEGVGPHEGTDRAAGGSAIERPRLDSRYAVTAQDEDPSLAHTQSREYVAGQLPPLTVEEEERSFKWLREATDVGELWRELGVLQDANVLECREEAYRRLADGEYEVLAPDENGVRGVRLNPYRRHLVDFYSNDPDGNPVRITIPEAKFPEAYKTKRKMNWIEDLIHVATDHMIGPRHEEAEASC